MMKTINPYLLISFDFSNERTDLSKKSKYSIILALTYIKSFTEASY